MNLGLLKLLVIFSVFMAITGAHAEWNSDEVSTIQSADSDESITSSPMDSVNANQDDEDESSSDSDDF